MTRLLDFGSQRLGACQPRAIRGQDDRRTVMMASMMTSRRIAAIAVVAFLVLSLGVSWGLTGGVDATVKDLFRPGDEWNTLQRRADIIVQGLRPVIILTAALLLAVAVSVARRSIRPFILAMLGCGLTTALTATTKLLLSRPDPGGLVGASGGSFPSGHTATLVVGSGLIALLLVPQARAWWLMPIVLGLLMGTSLLIQAAHWASDVVGGGLLGTAVLSTICVTGLHHFATGVSSDADPGCADRRTVTRSPEEEADESGLYPGNGSFGIAHHGAGAPVRPQHRDLGVVRRGHPDP